MRVGLGGVVASEDGWQEVLEERRLEASLPPDQDEDDVVHHLRVERGGDHPDEPAAETEVETIGVAVGGVHHCSQVADMVRHAIPRSRLFEKLLQRVVAGREVGEQERAQVEEVGLQPVAAHGAPKGVLDRVGHGSPAVGCGDAVGDGAVFELVCQLVHPQLHGAADEALHLFDGGLALPPVPVAGGDIGELHCGVLGSQGVAALGCGADGGRVIVGEQLDGPCLGFGLRHAETVHQVEASADVVVVAAGCVVYALFFHKPAYGVLGACGRCLPPSVFLSCGDVLFLSGLGAGQGGELHPFGVGTVERVGVVADHGHARGVLALPVDGDAGEPGVVGVYRLPGCGEVLFRHFAFHPCDDTYAASGQGLVGKERVRVGPYPFEGLVEDLFGDAVDVHHDGARIAFDVLRGASSLQVDGRDEGGLVLLDLALLPFRRFGVLSFAGCKRAEQGGGGGMALAGQFLHDFFPCAGRGGGCAEREEARGAECVFHVKCFIKFVQCSDVPFGGRSVRSIL